MIPVVKASALFILCEKLPQLPSCGEAGDRLEDVFRCGGMNLWLTFFSRCGILNS